ncbi:MBL fold metallo-hydrolase [Natronospora cellulosivora (SeqCode)]
MEYQDITDDVAIIAGFNNVGIIKNGQESILIDSGLEDDTAKKIYKLMNDRDLRPAAVINTHSHADHCGGNSYLQQNYGVDIISSAIEKVFIENTCLEPICFFSGSRPINDLENKFLQASPSLVTKVVEAEERLSIGNLEIKIVSLPGHSLDQIAIEFNDILFCGDAFFSDYVLEKYKLPFLIDLDNTIKSLKFLKESDYKIYIPSHGEPTKDIVEIANLNISKIKKIEEDIITILGEKRTTEGLLRDIFSKYNIKTSSAQQYYLLKTTVMAYLSSLYNRDIIKMTLKDNILGWQAV